MINLVYSVVKTIINKESRGHLKPESFNDLAKQAQDEIFREYFDSLSRDYTKESRGFSHNDLANLANLQNQRINQFLVGPTTLSYSGGLFTLPTNLYLVTRGGIDYNGNTIEEVTNTGIYYQNNSPEASPSTLFPVYERIGNTVKVYPATIVDTVSCRYIKKPATPKWTYVLDANVNELFDNTAGDYQDFELHPSEFSNLVIKILSYTGIRIREAVVTQYAEGLKNIQNIKEEN